MNALVFGDLHATEGSDRCRQDKSLPLQRWRVSQFMRRLAELKHEHGCDYLIDLGDTTSERHSVPTATIQQLTAGLEALQPDPILSIKLIGNHEQLYKSGNIHPGGMYARFHRVVESRLTVIIKRHSVAVVCVSFPEDDAEAATWIDQELDALHNAGYRTLLLGHFQVAGCKLSGGAAKTGIPAGVVGKASCALLGHVHRPQLIPGTVNAHYVGSPFQQSFGETGEVKRVAKLNLATLELSWIELPDFPRYRRVSLAQLPRQVNDLGEDRYEVSLASPAEADLFFQHPLASLVTPVVAYETAQTQESAANTVHTDERSWLTRYAELNPIDVDGITTDQLVEHGLKLLEA